MSKKKPCENHDFSWSGCCDYCFIELRNAGWPMGESSLHPACSSKDCTMIDCPKHGQHRKSDYKPKPRPLTMEDLI